MKDLIEALNIFLKYTQAENPTNCSHDVLWVDVDETKVSKEDKKRLDKLGFFISSEDGGFMSFRFGSC